jgi:O-antigen/teichoic acid export membrane protein
MAILLTVVPAYLRLLGAEAYGLVGFFTMLSAAAIAFDFGLSFTVNRELARLTANPSSADGKGLVAILHLGCWAAALLVGGAFTLAVPWLASSWLRLSTLSPAEAARALTLMGAALPLVIARNFYVAGLNGLQRQGLANACLTGGLAVRSAVTVLALLLTGGHVTVFFCAQLAMLTVETVVAGGTLWNALPPAARGGGLGVGAAIQRMRFSAGVSGTMLLGLALTYVDQAILSRLLPLAEFGYYTIACALAATLGYIVQPVTSAVYPRFTQLVEHRDARAVSETYHFYSQVVAVLVAPCGLVLVCFPGEMLTLWTGQPRVAETVAAALSLRAIGTTLNTLMHVPHVLQLAFGWSSLGVAANALALLVVAPLTVTLARHGGAAGAAAAWIALNVGQIVLAMGRMHSRVLVGERGRWYGGTLAPAGAAAVAVLAARLAMPTGLGPAATAAWLALSYMTGVAAALVGAPAARAESFRTAARWRSR